MKSAADEKSILTLVNSPSTDVAAAPTHLGKFRPRLEEGTFGHARA